MRMPSSLASGKPLADRFRLQRFGRRVCRRQSQPGRRRRCCYTLHTLHPLAAAAAVAVQRGLVLRRELAVSVEPELGAAVA